MLGISRVSLSNQWRHHVAPQSTVTDMYRALVQKGVLQNDPAQVQMCELCSPLLDAISGHKTAPTVDSTSARFAVLRRAYRSLVQLAARYKSLSSSSTAIDIRWPENVGASHSTGLYLWGDVGIGKTMVLDLFELCPTPGFNKRRAHLHSFMTELHERLHLTEQRAAANRSSTTLRPIEQVVDEILAETPILLFDEFQTFDVAHATLLASFFGEAFKKGVFLLTTSNRPPQELGLLSTSFRSMLPLMSRHCTVVHCKAARDYRGHSNRCSHQNIFLSPNSSENEHKLIDRLEGGFCGLSPTEWECEAKLMHFGREVVVPRRRGGVAVFHFSEICGSVQPLGPADFQLLARTFHTIVIFHVPQIGAVAKNAAKQFIILVDELYQHKVKLLMTHPVPWANLMDEPLDGVVHSSECFAEGTDDRSIGDHDVHGDNEEERLSYARIKSRLREMGTVEYLTSNHTLFVVDDFRLDALV